MPVCSVLRWCNIVMFTYFSAIYCDIFWKILAFTYFYDAFWGVGLADGQLKEACRMKLALNLGYSVLLCIFCSKPSWFRNYYYGIVLRWTYLCPRALHDRNPTEWTDMAKKRGKSCKQSQPISDYNHSSVRSLSSSILSWPPCLFI